MSYCILIRDRAGEAKDVLRWPVKRGQGAFQRSRPITRTCVYPVETFSQVFSLFRKLEEIADRIDTNAMIDMLEQRDPNKTIPYLYSFL